jgi:RsiW-degrading membrane proteinase PrsW (M82 family)
MITYLLGVIVTVILIIIGCTIEYYRDNEDYELPLGAIVAMVLIAFCSWLGALLVTGMIVIEALKKADFDKTIIYIKKPKKKV